MGIIICASYRKELCEILMERWTMPRSSRPQLSFLGSKAQQDGWGGKIVNALTAASGGICLFVEL